MLHFECKVWVGVSPRTRLSISFLRSHARAFSLVRSGSVVAWGKHFQREKKQTKYHLVEVEPEEYSLHIILFSHLSIHQEAHNQLLCRAGT